MKLTYMGRTISGSYLMIAFGISNIIEASESVIRESSYRIIMNSFNMSEKSWKVYYSYLIELNLLTF
jgi:hypothetical protein